MSASPVDRYIDATRLHLRGRVQQHYYAESVKRIRDLAAHFGVAVDVKIVYSLSRRVEHVKIGEVLWLVYDQYMGQSVNLLNRLFVEAADIEPAIVYFHKVLAERLVEVSMVDEAIHCALVYRNGRDALMGRAVDERWRAVLTSTHERFMLFHEFGHCLYGQPQILSHVREQVEQLIEHQIASKTRTPSQILADVRSAPPAAIHHQDPQAFYKDTQRRLESGEDLKFHAALLASLADEQIRQEIFCDVFAADLVWTETALNGLNRVETLRAVYIGFYHLQALEYLRRFPYLSSQVDWSTDNTPRMQVRSHCLRWHLVFLFQASLIEDGVKDKAEIEAAASAFDIQLMEDQKKCYETVNDGAMNVCDSLRREGYIRKLGEATAREIEATVRKGKRARRLSETEFGQVALLMTGWASR